MPEDDVDRPRPWKRGCLIALGVAAFAALACGAGVLALGWSVWQRPSVQVGVRAAGAAMEMNREALQAPGAQALRDAGCRHAMVYSPALMSRFVEALALDGGQIAAPDLPLLICAVRASPPSCEALAQAYAAAVPAAPDEVQVDVFVQGESAPRCAAVHGRDGEQVREQTLDEGRFGAVVRPRVF